jgi:hypothetical protein
MTPMDYSSGHLRGPEILTSSGLRLPDGLKDYGPVEGVASHTECIAARSAD